MADLGIYDLIMGESPDAKRTAAAMAQAIRGGRSRQNLYALGAANVPDALMQVHGGQAAQDAGLFEKATEARARLGQEAQHFKQSLAQQAQEAKARESLMKAQYALQGSQYAADSRLQGQLLKANEDRHQQDKDDAAWERYVKATNAGLSTSRSVLGMDRNVMNRVDRTLVLINNKPWLTPEEMADVNVSLAGVLTGGNQAARKTIDEISYKTLGMRLAEAAQYIANKPQNANAQLFVKRIASTLQAEREAAKARILETVRDQATGMQEVLRRKGKTAIDYHREIGLDDPFLARLGMDVQGYPAQVQASPATAAPKTGGRFTHPKYPGKFFDADGNEVR